MWDEAVYRNALRLKSQIESGEFIPEDIKKQIKRNIQLKNEEKLILRKDRVMDRKKNKLKYVLLMVMYYDNLWGFWFLTIGVWVCIGVCLISSSDCNILCCDQSLRWVHYLPLFVLHPPFCIASDQWINNIWLMGSVGTIEGQFFVLV